MAKIRPIKIAVKPEMQRWIDQAIPNMWYNEPMSVLFEERMEQVRAKRRVRCRLDPETLDLYRGE